MLKPKLKMLDGEFTVYRFAPDAEIPARVFDSAIYWIAKTDEELSVVCDSRLSLAGGDSNPGWACVKVCGPIDFSQTGILAGISGVLAAAEISIFAISTYDTDYILLPAVQLEKAAAALAARGYDITGPRSIRPTT